MKRKDGEQAQESQDTTFATWSERIRSSDHRAFSELFEAMHAALLRYAYRYTGHKEAARDIVQDAFLKVWQARATIDPARSLKGLLYTIVRNLSLNYKRSGQHAMDPIPRSGIFDASHAADLQLDGTIMGQHLQKFIDELPPRRREAFVLSRREGLSHKEIAEVMNLTSRTVNTHIVLALRTLRERVEALQTIEAHDE